MFDLTSNHLVSIYMASLLITTPTLKSHLHITAHQICCNWFCLLYCILLSVKTNKPLVIGTLLQRCNNILQKVNAQQPEWLQAGAYDIEKSWKEKRKIPHTTIACKNSHYTATLQLCNNRWTLWGSNIAIYWFLLYAIEVCIILY